MYNLTLGEGYRATQIEFAGDNPDSTDCPYCGSKNTEIVGVGYRNTPRFCMFCNDCRGRGPKKSSQDAVKKQPWGNAVDKSKASNATSVKWSVY